MKNFFLVQLLQYLGRKLDGYKTTIGGIGLILMGVIGIVNLAFEFGWVDWSLETSIGFLAGGFTALGFGGKLEKLKLELKKLEGGPK